MVAIEEITASALEDVSRALWLADNPNGDWPKLVEWSMTGIKPSGYMTKREAQQLKDGWAAEVSRYRLRAQVAIAATLNHVSNL